MLNELKALNIPVTTCTIYNPCFPKSEEQTSCETGLCALNDVIVTESSKVYRTQKDLSTESRLLSLLVAWYSCDRFENAFQ